MTCLNPIGTPTSILIILGLPGKLPISFRNSFWGNTCQSGHVVCHGKNSHRGPSFFVGRPARWNHQWGYGGGKKTGLVSRISHPLGWLEMVYGDGAVWVYYWFTTLKQHILHKAHKTHWIKVKILKSCCMHFACIYFAIFLGWFTLMVLAHHWPKVIG